MHKIIDLTRPSICDLAPPGMWKQTRKRATPYSENGHYCGQQSRDVEQAFNVFLTISSLPVGWNLYIYLLMPILTHQAEGQAPKICCEAVSYM